MVPTAVFLVSALSSNQDELVHFAPLQSTPLVNMRLASLEMSSGSSLSVRQHSTCQAGYPWPALLMSIRRSEE